MGRGVAGRLLGGYRSALANRDLRLLLGALAISSAGSWAYNVGLLALLFERTHSLGWVAAGGLARWIPSLLLSTYAGVIAERTERIRLMAGADLLSTLWQGLLVLVAALSGPVVICLLLCALTSVTQLVYTPAVAATLPAVADEDSLVAANALNGTVDNLAVIAGPAIGAALLLIGPPSVTFAVNAASFLVSALMVLRIRTRSVPVDVTEGGAAGAWRQMGVGVRAIVDAGAARTMVAFGLLVSFVYGTDTVLLLAVSEHRLHAGGHGFGYLLGAVGVGGVLAAIVVDRMAASRTLAPIIFAGVAGYTLPTALLTLTHSTGLAIALEVVRGASTLIVDVLAITALQRAVPAQQLARVFGVYWSLVLAAVAIGTLVTPVLVSAGGLDTALLVLAFAPCAVGAVGLPALLAIDRAGAATATALAPRVAVIEHMSIFASASRAVLESLAGAMEDASFDAGTVIIREGAEADDLFVLVEGEVEVTAHGEAGGPPRVLRRMTAPTYFGEIGVLERIPRTATVTAVTDCVCNTIDGEALLAALAAAPPSKTLMENTRSYLAITHPSRRSTFAAGD